VLAFIHSCQGEGINAAAVTTTTNNVAIIVILIRKKVSDIAGRTLFYTISFISIDRKN
jgi:hypothetical protein